MRVVKRTASARWLGALLALSSAIALADDYAYLPPVAIKSTDLWSTAETNLYVSATGSDSNACTSPGANACATIVGALNKIPKGKVLHPYVINVGVGSFAGASIEGWVFGHTPGTTQEGSLKILGTLSTYTPTSGPSTFSFTSQVVGSLTSSTWGTLTTAQSWPDHELIGKLVEITSGGGLGAIRSIADNVSGVISLVGGSNSSATTGSVWTIRDWGTTITVAGFPSPSLGFGVQASFAPFMIGGIYTGNAGNVGLQFQRLRFSGIRGVYISGPVFGLGITQCRFDTTTNDAILQGTRFAFTGSFSDNVFNTGTRYGIGLDTIDYLGLSRNSIIGGLGFRFWSYRYVATAQTYCSSAAALACENYGLGGYVQVQYGHYVSNTASWPCIGFSASGGGIPTGGGSAILTDNVFTGCSGSAVMAQGPVNVNATSQTGSGNGRYGIEALRGAQVVLVSGNTVTGTLGDTAVGPTPTVTAYGSVSTGVSSTADFSRISP